MKAKKNLQLKKKKEFYKEKTIEFSEIKSQEKGGVNSYMRWFKSLRTVGLNMGKGVVF